MQAFESRQHWETMWDEFIDSVWKNHQEQLIHYNVRNDTENVFKYSIYLFNSWLRMPSPTVKLLSGQWPILFIILGFGHICFLQHKAKQALMEF